VTCVEKRIQSERPAGGRLERPKLLEEVSGGSVLGERAIKWGSLFLSAVPATTGEVGNSRAGGGQKGKEKDAILKWGPRRFDLIGSLRWAGGKKRGKVNSEDSSDLSIHSGKKRMLKWLWGR